MFIHLNCHSNYSFLAGEPPETKDNSQASSHVVGGANNIDDLIHHAAALGYPALALTDTNGLYGAVAFYQSARKAGIKPIFGTEIVQGAQRAILLAKNLQGFAELCRVISDRHLKPDFSLTRRLKQCSGDIIILCPDKKIVKTLLATRGRENIYLEIDPSTLISRNPFAMVATNPIRFIRPEDWEVHRLLAAIKMNTTIHSVPSSALAPRDAWMKSPDEMAHLFRDMPAAVANTLKVAEQCNVELPIGETLIPSLPVNSKSQHGYLKKLVWEGTLKLYRHTHHLNQALQQLRHELKVIDDLNFSSYFLIVWDIVREAKARGIPTVGRGSAANSLVCRALNITEVDPIALNLYFERFLNPERSDYPDIDIDFPWNRRDEMLDYVFEKYGHENVALISAHVHFRGRSALREVGKALGVPIPEIETLTSRLPHFADLSGLDEIRANVPECRDLPLEDEPYRSMISLANQIDGFPRHLSIHCGGIIVSPFPITDRIPLQRTPKGFVVTQYDMYPVEDMGLLKIDLLAQKGLAVLAETVQEVEEKYGKKINFSGTSPGANEQYLPLEDKHALGSKNDCQSPSWQGKRSMTRHCERSEALIFPQKISCPERVNPKNSGSPRRFAARDDEHPGLVCPLREQGNEEPLFVKRFSQQVVDPVHDPKTQKLIREGKTIGCFYIESPGMRNLLRKLHVDSFEMLTAVSSIIRPGVSESGMMKAFIERHAASRRQQLAISSPCEQTRSRLKRNIASHPSGKTHMEGILKDTYGIMIYQEDVIKVAHKVGGMSLGEADSLRKCMSKKRDWQDINTHRDRFISGAMQNGVEKKSAEEIWRQIESFAGYAFCKAHSASFAIVSYQTAYLKAHYPAEFMAAVLSNRGGFYDACAYTEEARRMGIKILPPDIHLSEERFTATSVTLDSIGNDSLSWANLPSAQQAIANFPLGKARPRQACGEGSATSEQYLHLTDKRALSSKNHRQLPPRRAVRVGLSQVKGLSQNSIDEIIKNRPYTSFDDFLERTNISVSETESLIRCGALDTVGENGSPTRVKSSTGSTRSTGIDLFPPAVARAEMLWQLKLHQRRPRRALFSQSEPQIPKLPEYTLREKLLADLECLDLTVSEHPLHLYSFQNHKLAQTAICGDQLKKFSGKLATLIGWAITYKRTRTAKNELMKFMTLEDATAAFEVTLFPRVYKQFGHLLYDRGPYIVRGRVEQEDNMVTALWVGRLYEE
jgi:DNA polymerase III alpha subunit